MDASHDEVHDAMMVEFCNCIKRSFPGLKDEECEIMMYSYRLEAKRCYGSDQPSDDEALECISAALGPDSTDADVCRLLHYSFCGNALFETTSRCWHFWDPVEEQWVKCGTLQHFFFVTMVIRWYMAMVVDCLESPGPVVQKALKGTQGCKPLMALLQDSEDLVVEFLDERLSGTPYKFKFLNGVFDVATNAPYCGSCREWRSGSRVELISVTADHVKAEYEAWVNKYMRPYIGADEQLWNVFQINMGYLVSGEPNDKSFFVIGGVSDSGKSTLLDMCKLYLGDYYHCLNEDLLHSRNITAKTVSGMAGKWLLTFDDVDNSQLADGKRRAIQTGFLKKHTNPEITAGGRTIKRTWTASLLTLNQGSRFNAVDVGDPAAPGAVEQRKVFMWFQHAREKTKSFKESLSDTSFSTPNQRYAVRFLFDCCRKYHAASLESIHSIQPDVWNQKFRELCVDVSESASGFDSELVQATSELLTSILERAPMEMVERDLLIEKWMSDMTARKLQHGFSPSSPVTYAKVLYPLFKEAGFAVDITRKGKLGVYYFRGYKLKRSDTPRQPRRNLFSIMRSGASGQHSGVSSKHSGHLLSSPGAASTSAAVVPGSSTAATSAPQDAVIQPLDLPPEEGELPPEEAGKMLEAEFERSTRRSQGGDDEEGSAAKRARVD